MERNKAIRILEYMQSWNDICRTASDKAIDITITAINETENAYKELDKLVDDMEIYTAGRSIRRMFIYLYRKCRISLIRLKA